VFLLDERLLKIHTLIGIIKDTEAELELTLADSEPAKKRSPQKCSNCGGEGHTARTCSKEQGNVKTDALPQTTL
jgi:hypothetical protein